MDTPIQKARSGAAVPLAMPPANAPRPRVEAAPVKKAPMRIYRSLTLRPDEWLEIVAKGRRR